METASALSPPPPAKTVERSFCCRCQDEMNSAGCEHSRLKFIHCRRLYDRQLLAARVLRNLPRQGLLNANLCRPRFPVRLLTMYQIRRKEVSLLLLSFDLR